jgi:hypothetical protein
VEGGGFHQRRGIFGTGPGVEVAFAVGFIPGDQRDVGRQVDIQARVKLDVGVNRADFQQTIFQQLRNTQALGTGEGESLRAMPFSKRSRCSLRPTLGMIICRSWILRVDFRQHAGEKIGLFLVIALQYHAVARGEQIFQRSTSWSVG